MVSKISNAKETQDKLQDVDIFRSYVHYIAKPINETGESLDIGSESRAFEIDYAEEFTAVTKLFDKYSDFYINKDDFNIRGELGQDDEEETEVDPIEE